MLPAALVLHVLASAALPGAGAQEVPGRSEPERNVPQGSGPERNVPQGSGPERSAPQGKGAQREPSAQERQPAPNAQEPRREPNAQERRPVPIEQNLDEIPLPRDRQATMVLELTLDDALRLARLHNTDLAAASLVPQEAAQDLRGFQALFEPDLFAEAGLRRSESPQRNFFQPSVTRESYDFRTGWRQRVITGGLFELAYGVGKVHQSTAGGLFPTEQWSGDLSLNYTQPLLRGGWSSYTLRNVRIAEAVLTAESFRYGRSVQDTLIAVVTAYWDFVFARENYRVVFRSLELAREQLRITEERIRVRELAERDRVADEAEVARRMEELLAAENEIFTRQDELRRLLFDGRQEEMWARALEPVATIPVLAEQKPLDWRTLALTARRRRPDLAALRTDVLAAEVRVSAAANELMPQLDLVGNYSTFGVRDNFPDAFEDTRGFDFPDWTVRLEFVVPIGNNAARAAYDRARLELERVQRLLHAAELDSDLEVRDAVRQLETLALRIRASQEAVRFAETELDTTRQRYRVGATTQFEVQQRNQELQAARTTLLRNQLDYRIAEARLHYVQGVLRVSDAEAAGAGGSAPGGR